MQPLNLQCKNTPPPTVIITSPSNNSTVQKKKPVTINATATGVTKVEFYVDGTLQLTDTTSPYSYSWTPSQIKTYSLQANAYDALGNVGVATASVNVK